MTNLDEYIVLSILTIQCVGIKLHNEKMILCVLIAYINFESREIKGSQVSFLNFLYSSKMILIALDNMHGNGYIK